MLGQRKHRYTTLLVLALLVLPFQNCGVVAPGPNGAGSSSSISKNNGNSIGGYDGKVYSYRDPDKLCADGTAKAISSFSYDAASKTLSMIRENCVALAPARVVAADDWAWGADDQSVILYKGLNFIEDSGIDLCEGKDVGQYCGSTGALYGGEWRGSKYMIMPAGCNDSTNPTCTNAKNSDTVQRAFLEPDGSAPVKLGINSTDGLMNSWELAKLPNAAAARYCRSLSYGGYRDWYLPSHNEFIMVFNPKLSPLKINRGSYYALSTEAAESMAYQAYISSNSNWVAKVSVTGKSAARLVRCMRRYK